MTRNTGHRMCKNRTNRVGDFVSVEECGSFHSTDGGRMPQQADELVGRHGTSYYWANHYFKPKGDVYRNWVTDRYYPTQGLAIYDTWLPTTMKNNTFYDYFSEEGDAYRHAVGVHLNNKFRMSIKNTFLSNHTYINTPREIQTGIVECTDTGSICNEMFPYQKKFGVDFGNPPLLRQLGDGEKTFGFIDIEGTYNDGERAFVFAKDMTTMVTGCRNVDEAPGIGYPGVKICPLDVPSASMEVDFDGLPDGYQAGLQFRFESLLDSAGPLDLSGTSETFGGGIRPQIEAARTYTMKYLWNAPPSETQFKLWEADAGTSYRISVCIGANTVAQVMDTQRYIDHDCTPVGLNTAEAREVFSFEELNSVTDQEAFFRDGEWIHLKWNQISDRRLGGSFTWPRGDNVTVADTPNMLGGIDPFTWDVNYPSVWPAHMGDGGHVMTLMLDDTTYNGVIDCQPFEEPIQTTTTTTTTTTAGKLGAIIDKLSTYFRTKYINSITQGT